MGPATVTFYQGRATPRKFDAPVNVGMRPGYYYRARLSGIPEHPGLVLYPTFEVHGTLILPPAFSAAKFPIPIRLAADDLDAVANGSVITKVYYLENPDKAEPQATRPNDVLEYDVPRGRDIYHEARKRGRLMLVMHLGPREPSAQELAAGTVNGTILYPDQKVVASAQCPPNMTLATPQFIDPIAGPRPGIEEKFHDGGDRLTQAGLDAEGKLYGLDPEDAVAEWTDVRGRRHVTPSNRVCLYIPRFIGLRKEVPLARAEGFFGPNLALVIRRDEAMITRLPPVQTNQFQKPFAYRGRERVAEDKNATRIGLTQQLYVLEAVHIDIGPFELIGTRHALTLRKEQRLEMLKRIQLVEQFTSASGVAQAESVVTTAVAARVQNGAEVLETVLNVRDLTMCCEGCGPPPVDRPLCLIKCADRHSAKIGDEITFTLRYTNQSTRPLTDVAVTDSLSGRLEYVPGSAQSDRAAVMTIQANEAGSSILRWEVSGTLQPGESGRVKFRVKVR
jgi:uncharacterized repeat protein (TIGR01451 family)